MTAIEKHIKACKEAATRLNASRGARLDEWRLADTLLTVADYLGCLDTALDLCKVCGMPAESCACETCECGRKVVSEPCAVCLADPKKGRKYQEDDDE